MPDDRPPDECVHVADAIARGDLQVPPADSKIAAVRWVDNTEASRLLPDYPAKSVILRPDPPHVRHFTERGLAT